MSALKLQLTISPTGRLNLSGITPAKLAGLSATEVSRLHIEAGPEKLSLGECFKVEGAGTDTLIIEGATPRCDFIGAENEDGTIIVEGDVGFYAGRQMRGGRLEIRGNAGAFLASSLADGLIIVNGSVGDNLGAPLRGERDGMSGGIVVVKGQIGNSAGARMRRGTIVASGKIGSAAGERMMGGTVWSASGFGTDAGVQMRRGTLIAPSVDQMRPTFVDCGLHELGILNITNRYLREKLGDLAPSPITGSVRRFAGDMASIGRGEILLTAS
ncbi:Formylmethanofuran dehydrogenase subunit C [Candidatus Filomicrobium marinum]|uniref:Formylmethanofuran dehydrogenase subunit C n=1 Tax=Candidatus Filomicrobium marinum TaxID=1608628 RepID=A0A0D6JBN0_9HYPH|nr:formylmethanofuran dehydrogenase subunit C [Candidatus Filomicrobium marinum]CFX03714.1 Formylmethanofuran dehydrogenase subunit C [Candidatus Filomicrobium marinum]CPR15904.1 Formylmethanofuran dehydrogenase subunit C [Candidatus Filomicrobium marinum]